MGIYWLLCLFAKRTRRVLGLLLEVFFLSALGEKSLSEEQEFKGAEFRTWDEGVVDEEMSAEMMISGCSPTLCVEGHLWSRQGLGIFAGRRCLPVGVGLSGEVRLVCRDGGDREGFSDERKYLFKRRVCL